MLGELVVRQTLTPTRDHLPNSPYCTTQLTMNWKEKLAFAQLLELKGLYTVNTPALVSIWTLLWEKQGRGFYKETYFRPKNTPKKYPYYHCTRCWFITLLSYFRSSNCESITLQAIGTLVETITWQSMGLYGITNQWMVLFACSDWLLTLKIYCTISLVWKNQNRFLYK